MSGEEGDGARQRDEAWQRQLAELRERAFGRDGSEADIARLVAFEASRPAAEPSARREEPAAGEGSEPAMAEARPDADETEDPRPATSTAAVLPDRSAPSPHRIRLPPARTVLVGLLIAVIAGGLGWTVRSGPGSDGVVRPSGSASASAAAIPPAVVIRCVSSPDAVGPTLEISYPADSSEAPSAINDPVAACSRELRAERVDQALNTRVDELIRQRVQCGAVRAADTDGGTLWTFRVTTTAVEIRKGLNSQYFADEGAVSSRGCSPLEALDPLPPAPTSNVVCRPFTPKITVIAGALDEGACSAPAGRD